MKTREFRFRLDTGPVFQVVNPLYGDNLSKRKVRQQDEFFFRDRLSSSLVFTDTDYDLIMDAAIDFEFEIRIDLKLPDGSFQLEWFVGKFSKTDLEPDDDDKVVRVDPDPIDKYTKIVENLDREFNIYDLSPDIYPIDLKLQAILQVYIPGSEYVTNIIPGNYWEQSFDSFAVTNNPNWTDDFQFKYGGGFNYIPGGSGANLDPDVSGVYRIPISPATNSVRVDGVYEMFLETPTQWAIRRISDSVVVYRMPDSQPLNGTPGHFRSGGTFTSVTSSSQCQVYSVGFYTRFLTTALTLNGQATVPIVSPDPAPVGARYTRMIGFDEDDNFFADDLFVGHDGNSASDQGFGRFTNDAVNFSGLFFDQPTIPAGGQGQPYPISPQEWTGASFWFYYTSAFQTIQEGGDEDYTLQHAYRLPDILSVLLREVDPDLTHQADADHSQFLYTVNSIRDQLLMPMFSPKSNFIRINYNEPARKIPLKLRDLFTFLRDYHRVFGYIDDNDRFVLEHRSFYENGKSYTAQQIGLDLTTSLEPHTGNPWSFKTSKWKYTKADLSRQIRHTWMDEVSEAFEGFPIESLDPYVQLDKYDVINLPQMTSDISYISAGGERISPKGLVFFECELVSGRHTAPFLAVTIGNRSYTMHNGYASIVYAHDKYWRHGLPCVNVIINKVQVVAASAIKTRRQEVDHPGQTDFDEMELIRTSIGVGQIISVEENFGTGFLKLTLEHDTE